MVRILVTGVGAPGTVGTLEALRENPDREPVWIVGCDMNAEATGKWLCDAFRPTLRADNVDYLSSIQDICGRESIDVILPQTTAEVEKLAERRADLACPVVAADHEAIVKANDKLNLYDRESPVLVGPVIVKPRWSHGGKGQSVHQEGNVLAMAYLSGPEYSVDCFLGVALSVAVVRQAHQKRGGITTDTEVVDHESLAQRAIALGKRLGLTGIFGVQYMAGGDEWFWPEIPIDLNPRIMGTMIATVKAGANLPWFAVKEAFGDIVTEIPEVRIGTRYVRHWSGQVIPAEVPA